MNFKLFKICVKKCNNILLIVNQNIISNGYSNCLNNFSEIFFYKYSFTDYSTYKL